MSYQSLVAFEGWTFIAQILNLFIQMYLFKRFLFKPIQKILAQRQQVGEHRLHLLLDGPAVGKPAVLVQVADDLAVGQADRSLLIVQLAGQDVEQGGLSFPVGSHQTDAVLVVDGCTDVAQNAVRSVIFEYVFQ